jgi:hypothetical protein
MKKATLPGFRLLLSDATQERAGRWLRRSQFVRIEPRPKRRHVPAQHSSSSSPCSTPTAAESRRGSSPSGRGKWDVYPSAPVGGALRLAQVLNGEGHKLGQALLGSRGGWAIPTACD